LATRHDEAITITTACAEGKIIGHLPVNKTMPTHKRNRPTNRRGWWAIWRRDATREVVARSPAVRPRGGLEPHQPITLDLGLWFRNPGDEKGLTPECMGVRPVELRAIMNPTKHIGSDAVAHKALIKWPRPRECQGRG
jgi:hypothetical protein